MNSFKIQYSKNKSARVALFKELGCPNIFTHETTFHGVNRDIKGEEIDEDEVV